MVLGFFFPPFPALNLFLHPAGSHAGPFTSHSEATHSKDSDDDPARGEAGPPVRTSPRLTPSDRHAEKRHPATEKGGVSAEQLTGGGQRLFSMACIAAVTLHLYKKKMSPIFGPHDIRHIRVIVALLPAAAIFFLWLLCNENTLHVTLREGGNVPMRLIHRVKISQ